MGLLLLLVLLSTALRFRAWGGVSRRVGLSGWLAVTACVPIVAVLILLLQRWPIERAGRFSEAFDHYVELIDQDGDDQVREEAQFAREHLLQRFKEDQRVDREPILRCTGCRALLKHASGPYCASGGAALRDWQKQLRDSAEPVSA